MKKKTQEEYAEWVKEVESSLPETLKSNWKALAEAKEGFDLFGGHLRQKEFDRLQNEVKQAERAVLADRHAITNAMGMFAGEVMEVQEWWKTEAQKNEKLAQEYRGLHSQYQKAQAKLKELGLEDDDPQPLRSEVTVANTAASERLEKEFEALKRQVTVQNQAMPRILADYGAVLRESAKEGLDLDPAALMEYASRNSVDLRRAYQDLTADQRAEKAQKDHEAALEKAREEGKREALSKISSPERLAPSGPLPVEGLFTGQQAPSQSERVSNAAKRWMETGGSTQGF